MKIKKITPYAIVNKENESSGEAKQEEVPIFSLNLSPTEEMGYKETLEVAIHKLIFELEKAGAAKYVSKIEVE